MIKKRWIVFSQNSDHSESKAGLKGLLILVVPLKGTTETEAGKGLQVAGEDLDHPGTGHLDGGLDLLVDNYGHLVQIEIGIGGGTEKETRIREEIGMTETDRRSKSGEAYLQSRQICSVSAAQQSGLVVFQRWHSKAIFLRTLKNMDPSNQ